MTLKIIDRNLRTITTNANKLNTLIHETGVMILEHAQQHGDCTRALAIVKAMPASMRRTMLVMWFDSFSPIRVIEKNGKVGMLKEGAKGYVPFDVDAAKATPFYELAEQNPEEKPVDFAKLLQMFEQLGKRIEKSITEGKVNEADRPSAERMLETMRSTKFERVVADNDPNNVNLSSNAATSAAVNPREAVNG